MRNLIISMSAILFFIIILATCSEKKNPNIAHPLFSQGQEVKFKASKFGKKAIILTVDTMDKKNIVYLVSYFTLWDTRRIKRVSELELEKQ